MARWWPFRRAERRAASELALATEEERVKRALVVTRWEDGTEVIFGLASSVVDAVNVAGADELNEKLAQSANKSDEEYDEKFYDACEDLAIDVLPPYSPLPAPEPVVITLDLPPPNDDDLRSPQPQPSDLPRAAPPAHKHEDTFIAIYEEELVKVLSGETQDVFPHVPVPSAPSRAQGLSADDGSEQATGWTWPLLFRVLCVLLAFCVAWTTFLFIGIWNTYVAL